jgi:hypothetical protein
MAGLHTGAAISEGCPAGAALTLQRGIVSGREPREQQQKKESDLDSTEAVHAIILSCSAPFTSAGDDMDGSNRYSKCDTIGTFVARTHAKIGSPDNLTHGAGGHPGHRPHAGRRLLELPGRHGLRVHGRAGLPLPGRQVPHGLLRGQEARPWLRTLRSWECPDRTGEAALPARLAQRDRAVSLSGTCHGREGDRAAVPITGT